jgi:ribosomal protein S18 acetylase RimI-like enzyme
MEAVKVRILAEQDWREYRDIRLRSLLESPAAFSTTHAEEAARPDSFWQECMGRAERLLATGDGQPQGVVSLDRGEPGDSTGDVQDLWVAPGHRHTGIAWRLVEAATARASELGLTKVTYWVSTENGRAIAFATNFGFRPTSMRRTVETSSDEFGDQEIALVMTLANDSASPPNPTAPPIVSQHGPR